MERKVEVEQVNVASRYEYCILLHMCTDRCCRKAQRSLTLDPRPKTPYASRSHLKTELGMSELHNVRISALKLANKKARMGALRT